MTTPSTWERCIHTAIASQSRVRARFSPACATLLTTGTSSRPPLVEEEATIEPLTRWQGNSQLLEEQDLPATTILDRAAKGTRSTAIEVSPAAGYSTGCRPPPEPPPCTSKEKPTAGAPKTLLPGEFQLTSDPNAGGNALSLAHCPIRRR
jgi:hypothetical protein